MLPTNKLLKLPTGVSAYWIVKVLLKVFIIYLVVSMFYGIADDPQGLVGIFWFFVVIAAICVVWEIAFYNSIQFSVMEDRLTIDSGIITRHSVTIPFQNVQNIDAVSGIMRRMFGLSTLNIWTASPGQFNVTGKKGNANALHDP
ncbi:MAG: PH domain-containing protein, partial [Candidatus Pacebacteria bacterium]|nr:PH domain-containing protein [Candidatus Paceibacterota bacterium]